MPRTLVAAGLNTQPALRLVVVALMVRLFGVRRERRRNRRQHDVYDGDRARTDLRPVGDDAGDFGVGSA